MNVRRGRLLILASCFTVGIIAGVITTIHSPPQQPALAAEEPKALIPVTPPVFIPKPETRPDAGVCGSPVVSRIADELTRVTEGWLRNPCPVAEQIAVSATRHGVDPISIVAVGQAESSWKLDAISHKGAVGPMQVMPTTFYAMGGRNIYDWRENIDIGTRYLKEMLELARGDLELALAYYHAGPSRPDSTVRRLAKNYIATVSRHAGL